MNNVFHIQVVIFKWCQFIHHYRTEMNALKSLIYVEMNRSVSILQVTTFPHIPSSLLFVELLIDYLRYKSKF